MPADILDTTLESGSHQREINTREGFSHWQSRVFYIPKAIVLPQKTACPNERLTLNNGSLTGGGLISNSTGLRKVYAK
jgi:hypothetical protein